ncbi:MAG: hypothetical protein HYS21_10400 [Deltaproteobacteria bacterium]|nr:hypothetical protein [Deltaproteobacteria bacterium]
MGGTQRNNGIGNYLPYLALFSVSFLVYLKTIGFSFIPSWDDAEYVLENPYIRGLTADNIKFLFTNTFFANYAPLHILSYSLDYSIWGLDPKGYHLTNVILHSINACLAFALIEKITKNKAASLLASFIFALHPLNVENVAWIAERKTLLTTLFSFASILSYIRFREKGGLIFYILCLILFILALLSKPLTVTLPLTLAAYEIFFKKADRKLLIILPLFAISILGALTAVWAHIEHKSIEQGAMTIDVLLGAVYPTMLPIFWKYIRMIAWPFNLSGFYDATVYDSFFRLPVLASLIGWLAAFIAVIWKGTPQIRFWFFWFWIWLLPVSNIIPIPVYYADRYMYLPAIGFFVMASLLVIKLTGAINRKAVLYAVFAALVIFYGAASFMRADVWKDELAFWADTAKKSPGQDKAHLNLGYAYEMKGQYKEAEREYMAAVAIYPSPEALSNLNMVRMKMGLAPQ